MTLSRSQWAFALIGVTLFITSFFWHIGASPKVNGVSFVAPSRYIDQNIMTPVLDTKSNWIAITPYAFSSGNSPTINYNYSQQWWGERKEGTIATIQYAQALKLKVMLKPHVWVRGQGWTGDFKLDSNEDWEKWEKSYSDYILPLAKIANSLNVEMLCIGTEYRKAATLRPKFWRKLIVEVRKIYSGKVVYAANWDNYKNVVFWDQLDFIGIDAYFPLSSKRTPSVEELNKNWLGIKSEIKNFSKKWNKPILFTEFGYQSIEYTTDGHWKYNQDTLSVNLQNQVVAYQSIFDTFWEEPWFHGGFLWKWHSNHSRAGGVENKRFTPQNKPAQKTIRDWYGRY